MDLNTSKKVQTKMENDLAEKLAKRASRHLVNKTDKKAFKPAKGLAFLGALGWNIPIPTFLGVLLGRWCDTHYKVASVSWTLNFLLLGMLLGAFSAWLWLKREGIDHAQKEQNRRNLLVEQAQAESLSEGETLSDDAAEMTDKEENNEEESE